MPLSGLTVVLIDNGPNVRLRFEPGLQLALEACLAARDAGADPATRAWRIFAVTNRLIELHEIPENFGYLGQPTTQLAAAVNRVNILKPARLAIFTGDYDRHVNLGEPRDGTRAYLWSENVQQLPPVRWQALVCPAAAVVHEMIRAEAPDGAQEKPVR
ncbi:MAG: hypothetical protein ACRD3G_11470 [Vicinamibacterales bacterium]